MNEAPEVSTSLFIVGVGALLIVSWLLRSWRTYWRGEYRDRVNRIFLIMGPRWQKAAQAQYPFGLLVGWMIGLFLVVGYGAHRATGTFQTLLEVSFMLIFAATSLVVLTSFSIMLLNRPKFVVAPHARDFHGLAGDLLVSVYRRIRGKFNSTSQ